MTNDRAGVIKNPSARLRYAEGDWFAVPLHTSTPRFAIGVVARKARSGILLGYFFGPVMADPPTIGAETAPSASAAIPVGRFGDYSVKRGEWPLIGRRGWDRSEWPMPVFLRDELFTGRTYAVYYGDDPGSRPREEVVTGDLPSWPEDLMMAAGWVERRLTALLLPGVEHAS